MTSPLTLESNMPSQSPVFNLEPPRKSGVRRLAIFGGKPAFSVPLIVGKPVVPDRDAFFDRVNLAFDQSRLSNDGPLVQEFEAALAKKLGSREVVAVSSGTVALELVTRALALDGNVILPSFTYVATAHALAWHGIEPRFCDVRLDSHTIDPAAVEQLVDDETSAILGVHLWGRACEVGELKRIADRHGLKLVFDAAHAIGCSYDGRLIGSFGDAEVLSFHATKILSTFEGGAISTQNPKLAQELRQLRDFGQDPQKVVRRVGINAKMNEISAAYGLTGLENLGTQVEHNRSIYKAYEEGIKNLPGISLIRFDEQEQHNYQYVVIKVDPEKAGLDRNQLQYILRAENVFSRRYFSPACHRLLPYQNSKSQPKSLRNTELLEQLVLTMPTGSQIAVPAVEVVCDLIRAACQLRSSQ